MSNKLSLPFLSELLPAGVHPLVFDSLPSTNTYLREQAHLRADTHTLIVAASQTNGRGRFGREFFSPPDTGVYFSILLRPELEKDTAALITVAAALASAEACNAVFRVPTEIKWVNDVLVNGRKAVGILAEAFTDGDSYVILGIGANIAPPVSGFPPEIGDAGAFISTDEAISTWGASVDISAEGASVCVRERFVAETITRLLNYLERSNRLAIVSAYRERVKMAGKEVMVTSGAEQFAATVIGIDDDACLIVSRADGSIEHLSYGEVTLHNENL